MQAAEVRALGAQQSLANLGLQIEISDLDGLSTVEMADRVRLLGLPPELVASMGSQATTSNLFPLRAPLAGKIVAMNVVAGEVVDPTAALYTVADVRELWLVLDVRQEDAPLVKIGQKVEFRPSDGTTDVVDGKVVWVSTAADEQTRTLKVRVDVANQEAHLKANTFGTGKIILREEPAAVVVSNDAVHWDGHCNVVFVRDKNWFQPGSPQFFHVREVRPGVVERGQTEIIAGLVPGEVVATTNSNVLEAQLLKSSLGQGCGCVH
jgi:RND family efflux transporter MFP subunit